MFHLQQLQTIADNNNRTRTLGTSGFKATVDYIETQLRLKTNFNIFKQEFFVDERVTRNPILTSIISGTAKNYTYEKDFCEVIFSPSANFLTSVRLTIVPNFGCNDSDWENTRPYPATDSVVLVIHTENCSVYYKSVMARKYNVSGLLVYDNDMTAIDLPSVLMDNGANFPGMILSYELGTQLVEATRNHSWTNASIWIFFARGNTITVPVSSENICADTPTGNKIQTIVIGSHSDSIENTSGINDNGRLSNL